jgi:putative Mn2+ efflux pump MntP
VGYVLVKTHYRVPIVLEGISAVLFVVTILFCVVPMLNKLIDEHSGAFWETVYISHNSATAKEKQSQLFRVKLLAVFTLFCAIANTAGFALYYTHPLLQMLAVGVGISLCIFGHLLFSSILQSVKEKYAEEK